jgi:membrane fusion protein, multidrug efflux system
LSTFWKRIALPLLVVLVAIGVAAGLRATRPDVTAGSDAERVWPVAVVRAEPTTETPEIGAYGAIVATRILDLRPFVPGEIVAIGDGVVDGGMVAKGDLLFASDAFDFRIIVARRSAEADEIRAHIGELQVLVASETEMLAEQRTQQEIAARDVRRRETLKRRDVGSEKALDEARMILSEQDQARMLHQQTVARLNAQIEQEKAKLLAVEAEQRQAERDVERTRVIAPFDAFVMETDIALGQQVDSGDRLAQLIDIDRLEARFHLSGRDAARLLAGGDPIGRPVKVTWRVGPNERVFRGRVRRQGSTIDPTRGGIELFAGLDGLDANTALRPGAFVEVGVADRAFDAVVRLPASAMGVDGTVYTVVDQRLNVQQVTVVAEEARSVLVTGLAPGALVVTTRFPEISPGLKVIIRDPAGV